MATPKHCYCSTNTTTTTTTTSTTTTNNNNNNNNNNNKLCSSAHIKTTLWEDDLVKVEGAT
jgi:hypothetical protein